VVGAAGLDAPWAPVWARDGRSTCNGALARVRGRVQRAPTQAIMIQALEFSAAAP
jgi:hypothetical protein